MGFAVMSDELLELVNSNPISQEEMNNYLQALEEFDGPPSFIQGNLIALEVFDRCTEKCMAINLRLASLSQLLAADALIGWSQRSQEEGSYQVAENIYIAAGRNR